MTQHEEELAWGARRHEWNTDFEWKQTRGPFRRVTEEEAAFWDQNGYLLIENGLDRAELERLVEVIDPIEAREEEYLRKNMGGKAFIARAGEITFTLHLATKSDVVRRALGSDTLMDLSHDLVGKDARIYWDMSVYKKPGTKAPFPWHQDNGYTYVEPQQYVTFWIALTDATLKNGCPWVVPGWHRLGTLAHRVTNLGFVCFEEEPPQAIAVPAKAGDIVVFSSLTPHRTGPNLSTEVRKTYIVEVAREGAETIRRETDGGLSRTPCNFPRQLQLLRNGEPMISPETATRVRP